MPPRVTYWTGVWDPAREALSKEVESLRSVLAPGSPVVSFSAGNRTRPWPQDGVVRLSGRRWLALRALAALIERRGDVTHIFGAVNAWHFLRCLGRRPIVFTVALPGPALDRALYEGVAVFAAETAPLATALRRAGVPPERVRVIYPGVDLDRFKPAPPPPPRPFRILFASTPADPSEFDARGIPLLVELARRAPDVEVVMLWRAWGDGAAARRALEALAPPRNVRVERRGVSDMPSVYSSVHAVACLFAEGFGKSCPNSVVEGLACGRPAIVAETCGVAGLVGGRAAVSAARGVEATLAALETLRRGYERIADAARPLAEETFGLEPFTRAYEEAYAAAATAWAGRGPSRV